MPSRRFRWLVVKEFRELMASRAFWLLLLMIGPLVGHGFITAVDTYAEASGIAGGPAALAQGLSPLDGIFVPTFGAYDLAVTLLFPFVAIRLVAAEKASGAWKLLLQSPASSGAMLLAKGVTLLAGWLIAWIPGLCALRALETLRRNDLRAGVVESPARASAPLRAGRGVGGRRRRDRQRGGLCRHRDAGFHGGHVGTGIHRRRAGRRVGEARVLHSHRRAACLRAGTVPARHGAGYERHRDRRICARRHMAPRRAYDTRALPGVRGPAAGLHSFSGCRLAPAHRLGPQRESPQQLLRRRRSCARPHTPAAARHRVSVARRPAPDGPGPQHSGQAGTHPARRGDRTRRPFPRRTFRSSRRSLRRGLVRNGRPQIDDPLHHGADRARQSLSTGAGAAARPQ